MIIEPIGCIGYVDNKTAAKPAVVQSCPTQNPCPCPFFDPCANCRWRYEAWWGIVPPCAGCPWNRWTPPPYYFPTRTTPYYEVTC